MYKRQGRTYPATCLRNLISPNGPAHMVEFTYVRLMYARLRCYIILLVLIVSVWLWYLERKINERNATKWSSTTQKTHVRFIIVDARE